MAVFAGNPTDKRLVRSVRLLPIRGSDAPNAVAVAVDTTEGTDLVVSMLDPKRVDVAFGGGNLTTDGRLTAIVSQGGKALHACLVEGSHLDAPGVKLDLPVATYQGKVVDVGSAHGNSHFTLEGDLPNDPDLVGQTFFAIDGDSRRAYTIAAIEQVEGRLRVFTKRDGRGFEARPAQRWELPVTAHLNIAD